jgi:carotenoid cleavage dioxygenase
MNSGNFKASPQAALERRSFIRSVAAALSATVAGSAAAMAPPAAESSATTDPLAHLAHRLGVLEDVESIRKLQHTFAAYLNSRDYERIVELFASDSEVHLWGGVFIGKDVGVRRLYVEHFARRLSEEFREPVQDYLLSHVQHLDMIEVVPDRQCATARFHCLMRTEEGVGSGIPIMEMARQQGEGVLHWWEPGVFENTYAKTGSTWLITRLTYHSVGPAEVMLERVCAAARGATAFTSTYPGNPTGPDRLIGGVADAAGATRAGQGHTVVLTPA